MALPNNNSPSTKPSKELSKIKYDIFILISKMWHISIARKILNCSLLTYILTYIHTNILKTDTNIQFAKEWLIFKYFPLNTGQPIIGFPQKTEAAVNRYSSK